MTLQPTTQPPHGKASGGRPKRLRDSTIAKVDYKAKVAAARELWDGESKQTARTAGNASLVGSLKRTKRWSGNAAAAHMLVEYRGGGSHGPKIAAPLATVRELESKIRMVVQTYKLLEASGLDRMPLAEQLEQIGAYYVFDGRKQDRSDRRKAASREYDRSELFESALKKTKCMPKSKLDALILKLRESLR